MNTHRLFFLFWAMMILSGCAGHHMALTKGQASVDVSKKSIALLSVRVANQNKPGYQPDLSGAVICPEGETCSRPLPFLHKADSAIRSEKDRFNEFLLSFELDGGAYVLQWIGALYTVPMLLEAGGKIPLELKFTVQPNRISYLGHLDVILRERKNDTETRAGRLYPLIDQATAGFSTGTFDVVVEDRYDEDMKLFASEYPALQNARVDKTILPRWVRPENRDEK